MPVLNRCLKTENSRLESDQCLSAKLEIIWEFYVNLVVIYVFFPL